MTDDTDCMWTCTTCGHERGRAEEWADDHHPAGNRVMYCPECDAGRWHSPDESHTDRLTGDPLPPGTAT